jgi:hypothetical protein
MKILTYKKNNKTYNLKINDISILNNWCNYLETLSINYIITTK